MKSFFREVGWMMKFGTRRLFPSLSSMIPTAPDNESPNLVVYLHGLNSHPVYWKDHIKVWQELGVLDPTKNSNISVYCPNVLKRGRLPVDTCANPIFESIKLHYSCISLKDREFKKKSEKKLVLVGASNGARIGAYIDHLCRNDPTMAGIPVLFISIAGALNGTTQMDRLNNLYIAPILYSKDFIDEMVFDNPVNQTIIEHLKAPTLPHQGKRSFVFFASSTDTRVMPMDSSLPILNQEEECIIVHDVEHSCIVDYVVEPCFEYIRNFLGWERD